jgi:hypothetical protein
MAYDAAHGQVVLFGGCCSFGDTWTWNGTDWAIPFRASLRLKPSSGPPGSSVEVKGWSFGGAETVVLTFIDSTTGETRLKTVSTDPTGAFATWVKIPATATPGEQKVRAKSSGSGQTSKRTFMVT